MWVVKLGGSLCDSHALDPWLARLTALRATCALVVPGGGPFADAVRAAQARHGFDDALAHRLALLAMAQYGCLLAARAGGRLRARESLAGLDAQRLPSGASVWLPVAADAEAMTALPADWTVTSDSIALWLAGRLGARALLLVKSAPPPAGESPSAWAAAGYVDAHFPRLQAAVSTPVYWLVASEHEAFDDGWAATPPRARRV